MKPVQEAASAGRRLLHTRQSVCRGYVRGDGLLEFEARMQDISPDDAQLPFRPVASGGAVHDMRLVMTTSPDLVIQSMRAHLDESATPWCTEIETAYAALEGLKIGPGFVRELRTRVGAAAGCTHTTDLVEALAKAAMQTLFALRRQERAALSESERRALKPMLSLVDSCHAYRADGPAVQMLWPARPRGSDTPD